jgi:hypothetical protein
MVRSADGVHRFRRAAAPVHDFVRAVDKSVGNMVEKPLPAVGPEP